MNIMKNLFCKERVVCVGGVYIAQIKKYGRWEGLDKNGSGDSWIQVCFQLEYCAHDTQEQAMKHLLLNSPLLPVNHKVRVVANLFR